MNTRSFDAATEGDLVVLGQQLRRPARGVIGIAARCVCGRPTVVVTDPRLPDGTPFPTFYYLTHPAATAAVSTLEADGRMPAYAMLLDDPPRGEGLAGAYRLAHEAYLADRDAVSPVPEISGISAGGMPERVKCLHALVAHSLAAGPGLNPIGDRALQDADWSPLVCAC